MFFVSFTEANYRANTKVNPKRLARLLHGYNPYTVKYLVNGFTFGFRIGSVRTPSRRPHPPNNQPIHDHINEARELVNKEIQLGRVLGPFATTPIPELICSPLNLVEKVGAQGSVKYRLIHNLAHPYTDQAVNATIPDEQATVSYAPFDKAVEICLQLGQGCLICREDFSAAFRLFPIIFADLKLLGFRLDNAFFVNSSMAFGCRSSCRIFETFACSIEYIARRLTKADSITHYLDDFFLAHATREGCEEMVRIFHSITEYIGAPLAPEKREGPTTIMTFLGVTIDTVQQCIFIPQVKIEQAIDMIRALLSQSKATVRQIQRLAGKLQYVTKGIPAGRPFLRRLYNLLMTSMTKQERLRAAKLNPGHHVRLTAQVKHDLNVWLQFLTGENHAQDRQVPFLRSLNWVSGVELITDSSGNS